MTTRRKWVFGGVLLVCVVTAGIFAAKSLRLRHEAEKRMLGILRDQFHCDVSYSAVHVSPGWTLHASVENLVLRMHGREGFPPLLQVRNVAVDAKISDLLLSPARITRVRVTGMQIRIPPRRHPKGDVLPRTPSPAETAAPLVVVREIDVENGLLEMLPRNPEKPALEFPIHSVKMREFSLEKSSEFHAELTNPKPVGEIVSDGTFGPWNRDEPGDTPVSGSYSFQYADLATIHGLGGMLSSTGQYKGALNDLLVTGKTETPDFHLTISGNALPLETSFTSEVDGTNGDTRLENVEAMLAHSPLRVSGNIAGVPGMKGRAIDVEAQAEHARVEDFLLLAMHQKKPLMTGDVNLQARIHIPPGEEDVIQKMQLDGTFGVFGGHFNKKAVQSQVDKLSRKGSGRPGDLEVQNVLSNLQGKFRQRDAIMTFKNLSFDVPGASVRLDGTYGLSTGILDFHGTLRLEAKLSQTMTGFKAVLVTPFNGLFSKKGAGTVLPIKITGTQDHPSFALDFGHKKSNK